MPSKSMKLSQYNPADFDRGRSTLIEGLWLAARAIAFSSLNPLNASRIAVLRMFGAAIGRGVVVKPAVKITFPWRLAVGDDSWIGEGAWIDNLAQVTIGSDTCVSQGAYLCTGNHDWGKETFDLRTDPIAIGNGVWIAAMARIGPGVTLGDGSIVTLGAVVTRSVPAGHIGSPPALDLQVRPK
jgi:putative colanic acid biosynthesis acetyltransferase WcaF